MLGATMPKLAATFRKVAFGLNMRVQSAQAWRELDTVAQLKQSDWGSSPGC